MRGIMKFYLKNGDLSVYALACGYVQTYDRDSVYTKLYHSNGVYVVRTWSPLGRRAKEETFRLVSEARQAFRSHVKLTLKDLEG